MPAFHVSLNFDVQGPYVVGYPGIGQFYLALEEACAALDVAARSTSRWSAASPISDNFLVEHHFSRIEPPVDASRARQRGRRSSSSSARTDARARGADGARG